MSASGPIHNVIEQGSYTIDNVSAHLNPITIRDKFLEKKGTAPMEEVQPTQGGGITRVEYNALSAVIQWDVFDGVLWDEDKE